MISHLELRKEESPDIAVFTHKRSMETVIVTLGSYLSSVRECFLLVRSYSPVFYTRITAKVVLYVPHIPVVCD
jgi:ERCC4-related helicase